MNKTAFQVRKAGIRDIPALLTLINGFAAKGIMLPRTEFELSEHIRDFLVAYDGPALAGCVAIHIYTPSYAEVRSLAVDTDYQKHGVGRILMEAAEAEGRELGLKALFAFTYVDGFFFKQGYELADRGELPLKVWRDCVHCPKFQNCDEIAVMKRLEEGDFEGESLNEDELAELIQIGMPAIRR